MAIRAVTAAFFAVLLSETSAFGQVRASTGVIDGVVVDSNIASCRHSTQWLSRRARPDDALSEFEQRRRVSLGQFMTREQIEKLHFVETATYLLTFQSTLDRG